MIMSREIFYEFSASAVAARINDCECKMVITSDGGFRGEKTIDLKGIIDDVSVSITLLSLTQPMNTGRNII